MATPFNLNEKNRMKWAETLVENLAFYSGHDKKELNAAVKVMARLPITKSERQVIEYVVLHNTLGIKFDTLETQELEEILDQLTESNEK